MDAPAGAPQIELTQTKVAGYDGLAQSDSKSGGALLREDSVGSVEDDVNEMTMQQELTMLGGGDGLGGTFGGGDEMHGRGMSGEEYFETHPNDTSYEIDNTNRDLVGAGAVPLDMMSPDVSMMHDSEIKPKMRSKHGSFISIKSTQNGADTEAGSLPEDYEHL